MAIVIERLSGDNRQMTHYRFDKPSVSVGRGYGNDIRLQDPYVCAEHILIETQPEDGTILVRDLGSMNGMLVNGKPCVEAKVMPEDVLTLGKTRLRLFDSHAKVAPTLRLSVVEAKLAFLSDWRFALLIALLYAASLSYQTYTHTFKEFEFSSLVPRLLGEFVVLSVWPLLFGLLARLYKQDARLTNQFALLWSVALCGLALSWLNRWLQFNFPQLPLWYWVETLVAGGLFFVLLWTSLLIAFHQSLARRNRIALGATLIMLSLLLGWKQLNQASFSPSPQYRFSIMQPGYSLGEGMQVDDFIEQTDALYQRTKAQRDKP
ncbi:FHA domain-containing protein [Aliiglaciecola sp. CAU 1673]|uniref:FHA domain-containing protein n=1 Tax=Aliiglaciecola sp. CAU 1673 TaxID=3032595 RepID=UPI0023D9FFE0|nr:FHA domain-containing protein [Aliiglaciecola sp. CAU 1673]MDF2179992.1 FHA domain-containing protein [Aliiglaciecola sp. CAU 1673]